MDEPTLDISDLLPDNWETAQLFVDDIVAPTAKLWDAADAHVLLDAVARLDAWAAAVSTHDPDLGVTVELLCAETTRWIAVHGLRPADPVTAHDGARHAVTALTGVVADVLTGLARPAYGPKTAHQLIRRIGHQAIGLVERHGDWWLADAARS
jgi:hypothetical protein